MSAVFGETGPKNVEVLDHPTRRQSRVAGGPMPAAVGDEGKQQRGSLDSVMDAEAGDHFEMLPAPPAQQPRQNRTWAAVRPAVAPQLSSQMSSSTSSTVSFLFRPGKGVRGCRRVVPRRRWWWAKGVSRGILISCLRVSEGG